MTAVNRRECSCVRSLHHPYTLSATVDSVLANSIYIHKDETRRKLSLIAIHTRVHALTFEQRIKPCWSRLEAPHWFSSIQKPNYSQSSFATCFAGTAYAADRCPSTDSTEWSNTSRRHIFCSFGRCFSRSPTIELKAHPYPYCCDTIIITGTCSIIVNFILH